jgi:toxin ParE1/3/4
MASPRSSILWSPEAEEDLIDIWGYLAREATEEIADRQLNAIENACSTLEAWPLCGRPRDSLLPGMRSVPVHPYVIFYRARNETVEIVRVVDGRRDIDALFAQGVSP